MLSLGHSENKDIPTACTNGKHIWWNGEFIDELTEEETLGLMAHEVMHVIFNHCQKHGEPYDSEPKMCNIAMDVVINQIAKDEGFKLPEGGIEPEDRFRGMTWQQVFNIIKDEEKYQEMCKELTLEDIMQNPDLTDEEKKTIQQKVMQAAEAAKSAGKLPGGIQGLIDEIRTTKVDWKAYLRETMQSRFPMDYTWRRPNRKMLGGADELYMPTMDGTQVGTIAVHLDTSGSVHHDELVDFLSELNEISTEFNPEQIMIFYTDCEVAHIEVYERGEEITQLNTEGGGGTSFVPTFEYLEEHDIVPDQMLVFSDMEVWESCFPQKHPEFPVLFISTRDKYNVPFGDIVVINQ